MRLNKYLALSGVASRRRCDELIDLGKVTVNGQKAIKGMDVSDTDDVRVSGEKVSPVGEKIYIMLNKPVGYVCTCDDDKGRPTIMDLIQIDGMRLFPVGRLDYDSEGLLFLTNDGDLAFKLTHPRFRVEKEYLVSVKGDFTDDRLKEFCSGVVIDGVKTARCKAKILRRTPKITEVLATIHEGRNRQIRRMMEALGFTVDYLRRESMAGIKLNVTRGQWRYLEEHEADKLKSL